MDQFFGGRARYERRCFLTGKIYSKYAWLKIDGIVKELYDVVALPSVRGPMALSFKTHEIRCAITISGSDIFYNNTWLSNICNRLN